MSEGTMSGTTGALAAALAKAQSVMAGAKKDAQNPHLKSKYADLASVWEACRAALGANGLAVSQTFQQAGPDGVCVVTTLLHSSGEWVRSELYLPVTKRDAQGFGSAITYARRYSLAAMVGVAPEDDDGSAAVGTPKPGHGPIKPPPADASDSGPYKAQQFGNIDLSALDQAKELGAAMGLAGTMGSLHEVWMRVAAIRDRLPADILAQLEGIKNARKQELQPGRVA